MPSSRIALLGGGFAVSTSLEAWAANSPFAAAFGAQLSLRDVLLLGALVLMAAALAMRFAQRHHRSDRAASRPDLRWWKNP